MIVDPVTGEKIFIYGEYVEKAVERRDAYVLYHNSLRLPERVRKYEERGFRVDSYWETEWNEWFETQPESKEDSSYWDDESDDDEDRVRTHPLLDAARARWAHEEDAPRRAEAFIGSLNDILAGLGPPPTSPTPSRATTASYHPASP